MSSAPTPPRPDPIVGIDLGTTNSLVAIAGWAPEGASPAELSPRCLLDGHGRAMLPSVVRYDGGGRPVAIGVEAKRDAPRFPRSTISSVKRLMGRSLDDARADLATLPYHVREGPNRTARVAIPLDAAGQDTLISPQEVSAAILAELKRTAEGALGAEVRRAVITVPAYFDDAQRQATRDAARLAGLEAVRIVAEPTAAALAYGLGLREAAARFAGAGEAMQERAVVVYDLGGGTFDVSVLRITPNPVPLNPAHASSADDPPSVADVFQVLSTSGDTRLGGDDMDAAVVELLLKEQRDRDPAFTPGPGLIASLRDAAERAKITLSQAETVVIDPGPAGDHATASRLPRTLTRAEFEGLITPLVDRTIDSCRRALADARRSLGTTPISAVILVGGATRVPLVRRRVAEFFNLEPYTALDPDRVVALGAAVQGSVLMSGAGARGGTPAGLLLDVIPLSLGLETVGGAMAKLIMRNSTVPARASESFSTSVDNQTAIKLNVLQGEREMAADCRLLGAFELKGIPPMPAGIPQLKVEFLVDASGILSLRAVEMRSGKALSAQVVPNHGLTREEVERIERESLTHAREDMTRHRVADLVTHSAFDLSMIERQLTRHESALDADYAGDLRAKMGELRGLIQRARSDWRSVVPDDFQRAKEALDRASVRLHEVSITRSLQDPPARWPGE